MSLLSTTDQNPTAPRPPSSSSAVPDAGVIPLFAAVPPDRPRRRFAVIGTGHRAGMYVSAITGEHADVAELVAWCDTNPGRMAVHDREAGEALGLSGPAGLPQYAP
ncbi:MAG TPA: hypothetical protein VLQ67_07565, partial [Arachnia sp.]|nr:hypothetical protein [Arachnia sp.]